MRPVVHAKPFVTQMRRGRLPACSCRHEIVDRLHRPSGRNASSNGVTPSTIMSPIRSQTGSRTEIRLGVRVHDICLTYYAHGPPSHRVLLSIQTLRLTRGVLHR
jgi:hypothetical protein